MTNVDPFITDFTLVNADTDQDVLTLSDGMTLDLSKLPRRLNVRANTFGFAASVEIGIDGRKHIENAPPFALFNDLSGDYAAGTFTAGKHTVTARAFDYPNGTGGYASYLASVHINVVNQPPAATGAVTSMILFSPATKQDIKVLKDFDTIDLSLLPKTLGIRATTSGVVGSVRYVVDAQLNTAAAAALTVGQHTITALPFAGANGTGVQGASKQLRLTITRPAVAKTSTVCSTVVSVPSEIDGMRNVARDTAGNVYVFGRYDGYVAFNPGGTIGSGDMGLFLAKLSPANQLLWLKPLDLSFSQTPYYYQCAGLGIDGGGNVYVAASDQQTFWFPPNHRGPLFVERFDGAGVMQWRRLVDGALGVTAFGVDAAGNSFVSGAFSGAVDFDPGAGVKSLTAASSTSESAFVLKLDSTAAFKAVSAFGGAGGTIQLTNMLLDGSGEPILTGVFSGTVDFNPAAAVKAITARGNDAYVAKLTAAAALEWVALVGGTGVNVVTTAATTGADGAVYCTGTFDGLGSGSVVTFDAGVSGAAGVSKTIKGTTDGFVIKLSGDGRLAWVDQFGGAELATEPVGVTVAGDGTVYAAGNMTGTTGKSADFDPGSGVAAITKSVGQSDEFICVLKADGSLARTKVFYGTDNWYSGAAATAVTVDPAGDAYVAAYGFGHVTSDSGFDDFLSTVNGTYDGKFVYLTRLTPTGDATTAELVRGWRPEVSIAAPFFTPDGKSVYLLIDGDYVLSFDQQLIRVTF